MPTERNIIESSRACYSGVVSGTLSCLRTCGPSDWNAAPAALMRSQTIVYTLSPAFLTPALHRRLKFT